MHQIAWDSRSGEIDLLCPNSIHYCLEIPIRWQLRRVSFQWARTNSNLGLCDWNPGPVIFGPKSLRDQFYAPNSETARGQRQGIKLLHCISWSGSAKLKI